MVRCSQPFFHKVYVLLAQITLMEKCRQIPKSCYLYYASLYYYSACSLNIGVSHISLECLRDLSYFDTRLYDLDTAVFSL